MTTEQMNHYQRPPVEHPRRNPGSDLLRRWGTVQADELTVKELLALVVYWTHFVIDASYFKFSTGFDANWGVDDANANIKRVARLLGKEVMDAAVLEAEQEYRRRCGPRAWNIFVDGSPEEVAAYWTELSDWESEVGAACEPKPNPTDEDLDDVAF